MHLSRTFQTAARVAADELVRVAQLSREDRVDAATPREAVSVRAVCNESRHTSVTRPNTFFYFFYFIIIFILFHILLILMFMFIVFYSFVFRNPIL